MIQNVNPNAEFLKGYLNLQIPADSSQGPAIFEFERFRDLKVDWHKITSQPKDVDTIPDPIDDIKDYFEKSWRSAISEEQAKILLDPAQPFLNLKKSTSNPPPDPLPPFFWQVSNVYLNGNDGVQQLDCICLIHKQSNRLYVLVDKNFNAATEKILGWDVSLPSNKQAWESFDIKGFSISLVQAYEQAAHAKEFATTTTFIKREAILFKEEYERLNAQKAFIDLFNTNSDKFLETLFRPEGPTFQKFWDDEEELNKTADTYSNLKTKRFTVEQNMRQLAAKVKQYGYYLALIDETVPGAGSPINLTAGKIYQIKQDTYLRRDVIRRQQWKKIKDGKNEYWVKVWVEDPIWIPATFQNYVEVDLLKDPVSTAIAALTNYKVYFADLRNGGYFTEEDIPLSNILKQCEYDEDFRRKCVIVVPQYDYILSNKAYYVGAFFFKFPLPGIIPTAYPKVGLREELAYKLAWKGIELGQLISTINLAPGETRTITVSSKFSQTTAQTASFKSVNDVNTSESFDLSTEFQKQASQEFNRNETFQASASGGFGVGPFSASASASGSKSTSLKTFSAEMSRVAKKSAQAINRKVSQEITSTNSTTTQVSQETNKSIVISNINKGATLNLLFYQVNNIYEAATYLTGLEILISSTKELIAGSGIYETHSYKSNELARAVFDRLHPDILPGKNDIVPSNCPDIDCKNSDEPLPGEEKWCFYWRSLQCLLINALKDEYEDNGGDGTAGVIKTTNSPKFQKITKKIIGKGDFRKVYNLSKEITEDEFINGKNLFQILDTSLSVCDHFKILQTGLENIQILDEKAVTKSHLSIASGGLYVDTILGLVPATEPYSEKMRDLETLRVKAEIDSVMVSNDEIRAKTDILLKAETIIKELFIVTDGGKYLILLQLNKGISDIEKTHWEVYFDNLRVDNCEINIPAPAPAIAITIIWPGKPPAQEELKNNLFLRNNKTNQILRKF